MIDQVTVDEEFEVSVAVRNADGSTNQSFVGDIELELQPHPSGAVLSGDLVQPAVSGIATFPGLSLNQVGEDFRLLADAVSDATYAQVVSPPFDVVAGGGLPEYTLVIPGGNTVNVYDEAVLDGIPVGTAIDLTVNVTGDVEYLVWGTGWTFGSQFTLNVGADVEIQGFGGRGGSFVDAAFSGKDPGDGEDGGDAIELNGNTVSIANAGYIFGGGGGGGAGGAPSSNITAGSSGITALAYPAGGGAGRGWGSPVGGSAGALPDGRRTQILAFDTTPPFLWDEIDNLTTVTVTAGSATATQLSTDGDAGDTSAPGNGGVSAIITGDVNATSGAGGIGGDWGEAGANGAAGTASPETTNAAPGVGGNAGKAISLSGGTVIWLSGNTVDRVKGDVA